MLADDDVLQLFSAVFNNDLATLRDVVARGLDPKHVQFVIQTDEICMCSAAFENLGLDFLEDSLPASLGTAWSSANQNVDSGCVSEKDQSEELNLLPIFHWLESGMCDHVTIRNQSDDLIIYESDEFDYESDDDLDKELDLEVYGIKVTPQPSLPGDFTPKSPAVMSPFSPHLHPPEVNYYSVSPGLGNLASLDRTYDSNRELTEAMDKLVIGETEFPGGEGGGRDLPSGPFRCAAPCPPEDLLPSGGCSPAYLTEGESPDPDPSARRTSSLADILGAASGETPTGPPGAPREIPAPGPGGSAASPLVSPLRAAAVHPHRPGGGEAWVTTVDQQDGVTRPGVGDPDVSVNVLYGHVNEVIEADVKFAGMTPLHVAASRGHDDILKFLINQGCNINSVTMDTADTPLHLAARWGHASTLQLLLSNGADATKSNGVGNLPLQLAIDSGSSECVTLLLDQLVQPGTEVVVHAEQEETSHVVSHVARKSALLHCVAQDRAEMLHDMVQRFCVHVNDRSEEDGYALLHHAASSGAASCVTTLLRLGADVNAANNDGEAPLHLAARTGNASAARALLDGGACADAAAPDWLIGDNQTPLMVAAYNGHCDTVKELLPHCDVSCVSEYSDSALHYAAARGGVATVTALLRAGAAVNLRNVYDATPLWNCAVHVETLRAMLEAGAATDVPSTGYALDKSASAVYDAARLPVEVALLQGRHACALTLLHHGCRVCPGLADLMQTEEEPKPESIEIAREIGAFLSEPQSLRFLALSFVRETVAENNVCSVQKFNEIITGLPVLSNELKQKLRVQMQ